MVHERLQSTLIPIKQAFKTALENSAWAAGRHALMNRLVKLEGQILEQLLGARGWNGVSQPKSERPAVSVWLHN